MNVVIITNTVLTATLALLMAFFYFTYRTFPGFGQWTIGGGLISATCLMVALRGFVPISLAIVVQNLLFSLAAIFYLSGTRSFLNLSDMSRGWRLLPLVSAVFSGFSVYFFDSAAWRSLIVALAFSVPHLATSILIFQYYSKTKSPFSLVLGGEMALASSLILAWAMWSFTVPDFQLLTQHPAHTSYLIFFLLSQAVITFSFVMLNVERYEKYLLSTQDALKLSEEKFSRAFQSTPDAICITRKCDGKIVEVNESFSSMSGYSREEALSHSSIALSLWANPGDREKVVSLLANNKSMRDWEATFRKRSGELLDCLMSGETFVLNGEEHVLSVVRAITERKRSERELQNTLKRFYTILSSMRSGLFLVANEGKVEFVNKAFCDMFDIVDAPESLKGLTDSEVFDRIKNCFPNPSEALSRIREIVAQNRTVIGEEQSTREGRTYLREFIPVLVDGVSHGRLWSHTDITGIKLIQKELEEERNQARTYLDSAGVIMLILDAQGNIVLINSKGCEVLGYGQDELIGLNWFATCLSGEVRKEARGVFDKLISGDIAAEYSENPVLTKDGELRTIAWHNTFLRDSSQKILSIISSGEDVTERKRTEEALQTSEKFLEQIVENIPNMIFVKEARDLRFVRFNRAGEELLGYSREELLGKNDYDFFQHDQADFFTSRDREVIAEGKLRDIPEEEIDTKSCGKRILHTKKIPIIDSNGIPQLLVGISEDITENKRAQQESEALRTQLFQAQKMEAIGTLAGGIAHDFNNILQVIVGYSEFMLGRKKEGDKDYSDLHKIFEAGRRGTDLVKHLTAFSRREDPKLVPVRLNDEVTKIERLLHHTIPKNIVVNLRLNRDLEVIQADPSQIGQILMNLAVNARDAMPDGGKLTVGTENIQLDEGYCERHFNVLPGAYALLLVSDTGTGMDKETMSHIFEPFFTTKEVGKGTGLGLATVFGIVKQHQGHIMCYSEPGHGTTFKIYFPSSSVEEHHETVPNHSEVQGGTETILLVDDEETLRNLGSRILRKVGYDVILAENGRQALEIYARHPGRIALTLLDLVMPEMDGQKCLEEIMKVNPTAKVLITSGYPQDGISISLQAAGAKGFVDKPFDQKKLLSLIRDVIDSNE